MERSVLWLCATLTVLSLPAPALGDDVVAAQEHYIKGKRAFELGQYDEAISEYSLAYKAKDDPALLYNIAQAHRLAGHNGEAIRFYKIFIARVPNSPSRAECERRIQDLGKAQPVMPPELRDDPAGEAARRHYVAGVDAYDRGNYELAIDELERARDIKKSPTLDLIIGRTNERLNRGPMAVIAYKRFLATSPQSPEAAEVRSRVEALEQSEHAAASPAAAVASAPAPPTAYDRSAGRTKKIAGLVVGVAGIGLAVGGIACGLLAKQAGDQLTSGDQLHQPYDHAKEVAGKTDQILEGVFFGLGGAAVVTGAVLLALGYREAAHPPRIALRPALAPGLAGASAQVRF
jgi:tetratricopeptide (TPR) repeat protein